jgi:signal transduction histidine kinase
MLAEDPPDVEGAAESAERTIRDANRASQVIARLRSLFKKTATLSESFDLNDAIREVLALAFGELERARVTVQARLADDLPALTGDRVQLQQVVLNLVLNAAEAMALVHDGARLLAISTERDEGDRIRVVVRDTGPGFDPANANRLFETFYTTKPGGMGIGLSISRSIIERHQGRLWAECDDGHGATFGFSIPRVALLGRARNADDPPTAETLPVESSGGTL